MDRNRPATLQPAEEAARPSSAGAVPPERWSSDRRSVERRSVNLTGHLLFEGGEETCTVFDISPEGALISASDRIPINRPLRLRVTASGEFVGSVAWRRQDRMGLRFVQFGEDGLLTLSPPRKTIRLISRKSS